MSNPRGGVYVPRRLSELNFIREYCGNETLSSEKTFRMTKVIFDAGAAVGYAISTCL